MRQSKSWHSRTSGSISLFIAELPPCHYTYRICQNKMTCLALEESNRLFYSCPIYREAEDDDELDCSEELSSSSLSRLKGKGFAFLRLTSLSLLLLSEDESSSRSLFKFGSRVVTVEATASASATGSSVVPVRVGTGTSSSYLRIPDSKSQNTRFAINRIPAHHTSENKWSGSDQLSRLKSKYH